MHFLCLFLVMSASSSSLQPDISTFGILATNIDRPPELLSHRQSWNPMIWTFLLVTFTGCPAQTGLHNFLIFLLFWKGKGRGRQLHPGVFRTRTLSLDNPTGHAKVLGMPIEFRRLQLAELLIYLENPSIDTERAAQYNQMDRQREGRWNMNPEGVTYSQKKIFLSLQAVYHRSDLCVGTH